MPTEPNPQDLDAAMTAAMSGDPLPAPTPEVTEPTPAESLDTALEPEAPKAEEPAKELEPAKPADPAAPVEAAKVAPDATVEAEITGLGLKQKAAERMRELSGQAKEAATLKEALAAAGVTDVATLPELVERAKTAEEMVNLVVDTGANAEQYTKALDYLAASTAASNGDKAAAEKLWEYLTGEMAVVGRMLGKEIPGVVDPLAGHQDLVDEVDDGNITRARALELARARDAEADRAARTKQAQEQQASTVQQQQAQQQAIQSGKESLNALGQTLLKADPEGYAQKAPQLVAKLREIAVKFPPDQWATQGAIAYASIRVAPAGPPGAKQSVGPVRPTGPTPHLKAEYQSPEEALNAALDATDAGY